MQRSFTNQAKPQHAARATPEAVNALGLQWAALFGENSGALVFPTVSPTNDLPVITTATVAVPGLFGTALNFDGSTSVVAPLTGLSYIAVPWFSSAWVFQSNQSGYRPIWARTTPTGWYLSGGKSDWYAGGDHVGTTTIAASTWTHVAISSDGTNHYTYVDGRLDSSAVYNPVFVDSSGGIGSDGSNRFAGMIDNIMLGNVCPTPDQFRQLYENPLWWLDRPVRRRWRQTATIAATASIVASLTNTEDNESATIAATASIVASLIATDENESTTIAGAVGILCNLQKTEDNESGTIAATISLTASLTATEDNDAGTLASIVLIAAAITSTDGTESATLAAISLISCSVISTDGTEQASITGGTGTFCTLTATDGNEVCTFAATVSLTASILSTDGAELATITVATVVPTLINRIVTTSYIRRRNRTTSYIYRRVET